MAQAHVPHVAHVPHDTELSHEAAQALARGIFSSVATRETFPDAEALWKAAANVHTNVHAIDVHRSDTGSLACTSKVFGEGQRSYQSRVCIALPHHHFTVPIVSAAAVARLERLQASCREVALVSQESYDPPEGLLALVSAVARSQAPLEGLAILWHPALFQRGIAERQLIDGVCVRALRVALTRFGATLDRVLVIGFTSMEMVQRALPDIASSLKRLRSLEITYLAASNRTDQLFDQPDVAPLSALTALEQLSIACYTRYSPDVHSWERGPMRIAEASLAALAALSRLRTLRLDARLEMAALPAWSTLQSIALHPMGTAHAAGVELIARRWPALTTLTYRGGKGLTMRSHDLHADALGMARLAARGLCSSAVYIEREWDGGAPEESVQQQMAIADLPQTLPFVESLIVQGLYPPPMATWTEFLRRSVNCIYCQCGEQSFSELLDFLADDASRAQLVPRMVAVKWCVFSDSFGTWSRGLRSHCSRLAQRPAGDVAFLMLHTHDGSFADLMRETGAPVERVLGPVVREKTWWFPV